MSTPVIVEEGWTPPCYTKASDEVERITRAIELNILFKGLESAQKEIIVKAFAKRRFSKGDIIIQQGDTGDFFYIIDEGSCDIFVEGVGKVLESQQGDSFGELALMYNAPRAATVIAATDTITWALDRTTFKKTIMDTTMKKRAMLRDFISAIPLLRLLSDNEKLIIADALRADRYKPDDVIISEGGSGDSFYIIERGEVKCTKIEIPGEVCQRLKKGDYFGELALLTESTRAATVTAVTDTDVLWLDKTTFDRLLGPLKDILKSNSEMYEKYVDSISSGGINDARDGDNIIEEEDDECEEKHTGK